VFTIGKVVKGKRGCTVKGPAGSWGSDKDWKAVHNA
jgi:predicted glycosyl hydrolase (DUF1957 family)